MPARKRYKLIANPAAGRGRSNAARLQAEELFRQKGALFDLELTTGPRQAAEIALRSLAEYDAIVAVGGDGTVNELLPALAFSGKPLGIIPAGSGNDLVKSLNIPKDIGGAVDTVLRGATKTVDLGRINGRWFANGVGIGFDAAVNRASYEIDHSKRGLWLYVCALVRTLGRFDPVPLTVRMNGRSVARKLFLLTVGNGTTVGGGFRLTPHAQVDDGLLDVTMVAPLPVPVLLWHLPKVFRGTIERARRYAALDRTARLEVESARPVPIHVDGEIFDADGERIEIEAVRGALTVIGNW